jgi:hypothetical protein
MTKLSWCITSAALLLVVGAIVNRNFQSFPTTANSHTGGYNTSSSADNTRNGNLRQLVVAPKDDTQELPHASPMLPSPPNSNDATSTASISPLLPFVTKAGSQDRTKPRNLSSTVNRRESSSTRVGAAAQASATSSAAVSASAAATSSISSSNTAAITSSTTSTNIFVHGSSSSTVIHDSTTNSSVTTTGSTHGAISIIVGVGRSKCLGPSSPMKSSTTVVSSPPKSFSGLAPTSQPTVSVVPTAPSSPFSKSKAKRVLPPTLTSSKSKAKRVLPPTLTSSKSKAKRVLPPTLTSSKSKAKPSVSEVTTFDNSVFSVQEEPMIINKDVKPIPGRLFGNNSLAAASNNEGRGSTHSDVSSDLLPKKNTIGSSPHEKLGVINGTIYDDKNANGIQDNGEVGIAGLVVQIFDTTDSTSTTTTPTCEAVTDRNGFYLCDNLPWNRVYTIQPDLHSIDHSKYITVTGGILYPVELTEGKGREEKKIGINDGNALSYFGPKIEFQKGPKDNAGL